MPSSRKTFKKKVYRKKRSIRKKAPLARGVSNSMRLFRSKIQAYVSVAPDGVVAVSRYDFKSSYPLNFPGQYVNNSGTYGSISNTPGPLFLDGVSSMLARLMDTFDTYQVKSLRVDYMPAGIKTALVLSQSNGLAFSSTLSYVRDLDDVVLLASNQIALNNAIKPLSMNSKSTFTYYQPKISKGQWFNCQSFTNSPNAAPTQTSVMPENAYKSLKVWCSNIPVSNTAAQDVLGRFYLTWDVVFKGLNSAVI